MIRSCPDIFVEPGLDDKQKKRRAEIYVEATNAALAAFRQSAFASTPATASTRGRASMRRSLAETIEYVLKINAGSFSFEAANPRHEHEYHLFERVKVPDGKVLCPGVITHASNIVEHPELIAERLMRFAKLVGRENVMAGADCGFSSQALLQDRGASDGGVGEVQGHAAGRGPGERQTLAKRRTQRAGTRGARRTKRLCALERMDGGETPARKITKQREEANGQTNDPQGSCRPSLAELGGRCIGAGHRQDRSDHDLFRSVRRLGGADGQRHQALHEAEGRHRCRQED